MGKILQNILERRAVSLQQLSYLMLIIAVYYVVSRQLHYIAEAFYLNCQSAGIYDEKIAVRTCLGGRGVLGGHVHKNIVALNEYKGQQGKLKLRKFC